ncbi:MAG: CDP-alcohol phosphatidyltransferase family protein [Candidatus Zixiibacteriota bacterium]
MRIKFATKRLEDGFFAAIEPISRTLVSWEVHPHVVTVIGFLGNILAGILIWRGQLFWGGVTILLAGACDVIDGKLARETGKMSRYGALFDSTTDRYSEVAIHLGIVGYFHNQIGFVSLLVILALAGSISTSYVRARAEGLGISCSVGILQRQSRIVLLAVGAILGSIHHVFIIIALAIIALFSNITVVQRVIHSRRQLKSQLGEPQR